MQKTGLILSVSDEIHQKGPLSLPNCVDTQGCRMIAGAKKNRKKRK